MIGNNVRFEHTQSLVVGAKYDYLIGSMPSERILNITTQYLRVLPQTRGMRIRQKSECSMTLHIECHGEDECFRATPLNPLKVLS